MTSGVISVTQEDSWRLEYLLFTLVLSAFPACFSGGKKKNLEKKKKNENKMVFYDLYFILRCEYEVRCVGWWYMQGLWV